MQHLIFFDAHCSLCQRSIGFIMKIDRKEIFGFAPLDGKTASKYLDADLLRENTLILLENYNTNKKVWIRGRGVCRIFWLIGGPWRLLGWAWCIPFGVDGIYRLIAMHRRNLEHEGAFFSKEEKRRLLP